MAVGLLLQTFAAQMPEVFYFADKFAVSHKILLQVSHKRGMFTDYPDYNMKYPKRKREKQVVRIFIIIIISG